VANDELQIREITGENLDKSVNIIRRAFGTVAEEMGYTEALVSAFPAFTTVEKLNVLKSRGAVFFGGFIDGKQAGFAALEKEPDGKYYIKRISVLPEYRHSGLGRALVNHVIGYVRNKGETKLHLTMADENPVLRNWYLGMGFKETSIKKFEHLPFYVSFMERDIRQ
jgi:ribosomal protein S18 acetylase RimI-like enzyme